MQFGSSPHTMGHGVMRPDHLAIMQAGNLFVFGLNNPVMWIDPSGLFVRRAWEATWDFIDEYHELIIAGAAITAAAALTVATKGAAAPLLAKAAGTFGPVIEQGAKKAQQMGGLIQQAKTTGGGLIQDIPTRVAPRVQSRINIAMGPTRYSPSNSAGFRHVVDGHFNRAIANNRSVFSITQDRLKTILQRPDIVRSTATAIDNGRQFVRIADVGQTIGRASLNQGGGTTTWIKIITDAAGNLITTFPVAAP